MKDGQESTTRFERKYGAKKKGRPYLVLLNLPRKCAIPTGAIWKSFQTTQKVLQIRGDTFLNFTPDKFSVLRPQLTALHSSNFLIQISVETEPEAEDMVAEILSALFHETPSIFSDAVARKTFAKVFLTRADDWSENRRRILAHELEKLQDAGIRVGAGKIRVKKVRREDWANSWKKHFKPIEVGNALLVKPSWSKRRAKKNQAVVVLDPGLSFGTGQHATTKFCLEQLVHCRRAERQSFLDIGCGSGILAIAAAKLGYAAVRAFDFDAEAVRIARENAGGNSVKIQITRQDLTKLPVQSQMRFDVICANLTYDLLIENAARICARLKPHGNLVLAGILATQFSAVKNAYEKRGIKLLASRAEKEWKSGRFAACDDK